MALKGFILVQLYFLIATQYILVFVCHNVPLYLCVKCIAVQAGSVIKYNCVTFDLTLILSSKIHPNWL